MENERRRTHYKAWSSYCPHLFVLQSIVDVINGVGGSLGLAIGASLLTIAEFIIFLGRNYFETSALIGAWKCTFLSFEGIMIDSRPTDWLSNQPTNKSIIRQTSRFIGMFHFQWREVQGVSKNVFFRVFFIIMPLSPFLTGQQEAVIVNTRASWFFSSFRLFHGQIIVYNSL